MQPRSDLLNQALPKDKLKTKLFELFNVEIYSYHI